MSFSFDQKVKELHNTIDIWADEVRRELNLSSRLGSTIGISFMDGLTLDKIPEPPIDRGFYISSDLTIQIEVMSQQPNGDVVFVELADPLQKSHLMSGSIFSKMFNSVDG